MVMRGHRKVPPGRHARAAKLRQAAKACQARRRGGRRKPSGMWEMKEGVSPTAQDSGAGARPCRSATEGRVTAAATGAHVVAPAQDAMLVDEGAPSCLA